MKTGLKILLFVLLVLLALARAGIAVEIPAQSAVPALVVETPTPSAVPTAAPALWTGDSAPTTCIACYPPPCDCFPSCSPPR